MSFMDKVKQQAEQAMVKAQAGVAQGQAKLGEMNSSKQHNELLQTLGTAYYAQRRQGGPQEGVETALIALDKAVAAGPTATPPAPGTPSPGEPSGESSL